MSIALKVEPIVILGTLKETGTEFFLQLTEQGVGVGWPVLNGISANLECSACTLGLET